MYVEFDQDTCIGAFRCVSEWDTFRENRMDCKADLCDADEVAKNVFVRAVPEDTKVDAKWAARVCPVDAITVYNDDGTQLIP